MSKSASKWDRVKGGGVVIDLRQTGLKAADFDNALARVNGFIRNFKPPGIPMTEIILIEITKDGVVLLTRIRL